MQDKWISTYLKIGFHSNGLRLKKILIGGRGPHLVKSWLSSMLLLNEKNLPQNTLSFAAWSENMEILKRTIKDSWDSCPTWAGMTAYGSATPAGKAQIEEEKSA